MRKEKLNSVLKSNLDLRQFANSRVNIEKIDTDEYLITSTLKFYSCELRNWAYSFIKRMSKGRFEIEYITGVCSSPDGVYFK